jgi:uncharacterized membrane protein (DUF485 family)
MNIKEKYQFTKRFFYHLVRQPVIVFIEISSIILVLFVGIPFLITLPFQELRTQPVFYRWADGSAILFGLMLVTLIIGAIAKEVSGAAKEIYNMILEAFGDSYKNAKQDLNPKSIEPEIRHEFFGPIGEVVQYSGPIGKTGEK